MANPESASPPKLLNAHSVPQLVDSVDAFLFDCDGDYSSCTSSDLTISLLSSLTQNFIFIKFHRRDLEGWRSHRWRSTYTGYAAFYGSNFFSSSFPPPPPFSMILLFNPVRLATKIWWFCLLQTLALVTYIYIICLVNINSFSFVIK